MWQILGERDGKYEIPVSVKHGIGKPRFLASAL